MLRACERSVLLKNGPPTNIKQKYPNRPVVLSAKDCGLKLRPYLLYTTISHFEFAQASGTMLCQNCTMRMFRRTLSLFYCLLQSCTGNSSGSKFDSRYSPIVLFYTTQINPVFLATSTWLITFINKYTTITNTEPSRV